LWDIVNGQCVPHEEKTHDPAPCVEVDLSDGVARGHAVLKDLVGATQFLLIPTARISGIEDPQILDPDAPNYWDAAWEARYYVEERAQTPLPRNAMSLAINSEAGRTQNQLHIHVDCIRPDVQEALTAHLAQIGEAWAPFPVPLVGHTYRAIRVEHETLDSVNPFRVLADNDPKAAANMGEHTLVVVGATFPGDSRGFVILDDRADPASGDRGSGESLQDHSCALAQER
jgi:CDP-diacylglycerol pyrophosphatase